MCHVDREDRAKGSLETIRSWVMQGLKDEQTLSEETLNYRDSKVMLLDVWFVFAILQEFIREY